MKSLKLMNYTTEVPALKSILDIERLLARAGVNHVSKEYAGDGIVQGFVFGITTQYGDLLFKMPCDIEHVYTVLIKEKRRLRYDTKARVREQAERVAWRILLDWITAQLTMIQLEQVKPEQAFMPYAYDARSRMTLFEKMEESHFKMLSPGNGTDVLEETEKSVRASKKGL